MAFRIRQRDMLWGQAPCYLSLSLSPRSNYAERGNGVYCIPPPLLILLFLTRSLRTFNSSMAESLFFFWPRSCSLRPGSAFATAKSSSIAARTQHSSPFSPGDGLTLPHALSCNKFRPTPPPSSPQRGQQRALQLVSHFLSMNHPFFTDTAPAALPLSALTESKKQTQGKYYLPLFTLPLPLPLLLLPFRFE